MTKTCLEKNGHGEGIVTATWLVLASGIGQWTQDWTAGHLGIVGQWTVDGAAAGAFFKPIGKLAAGLCWMHCAGESNTEARLPRDRVGYI